MAFWDKGSFLRFSNNSAPHDNFAAHQGTAELQIKTLCGTKYTGTNDELSFTFCNFDQCCSTGGIRLTNGRQITANGNVVDCMTPDIFGSSKIGDCKDFEFGPGSMITGNITLSNIDGFRGEWIKIRSSNGSSLQCFIDGWIDGNNDIPNQNNVPKYREFSCSSKYIEFGYF